MTAEACIEFEPTLTEKLSIYNMFVQTYGVGFVGATLAERLKILKVIVEMMLMAEVDVDSADNPEYLSVNESLKFMAILHVAIVEGYAVKAAAKTL